MSHAEQNVSRINSKILSGEAIVYTEAEILGFLKEGPGPESLDMDVVTIAFTSSISGSADMILVPVSGRGVFTRAKSIRLNGVPAYPGPAPNERLGVVDTQVFADQTLEDGSGQCYAGAKLLTEILQNREIQVECLSSEGDIYHSKFKKEQLGFARMVTYNTFIPLSRINPSAGPQSNAHLDTLRVGSKILLNRAPGIVIGCGTRSFTGQLSLSLSADIFEMDPECAEDLSGFASIPIGVSVAFAIPILNNGVLQSIINYLSQIIDSDFSYCFESKDQETARQMRDLICREKFLLIDSHMPLRHFGGGNG
jgi:uncharacterized protein (DUF39 family)